MHPVTFVAAVAWLAALMGALVVLVLRGRSRVVRILALDTLTLVLVAMLVLFATERGEPAYLDAALALALLGFAGTLAAARYVTDGQVLR
ncbi:MAG TPA: monovalent cation/H+ antiporter complex subunit F [Candidatus Tectomicrobia bacterium]|nr:monovalent cation/H+ antiporter complex subunit F [Candidatus Tectomicrobia bacterium]